MTASVSLGEICQFMGGGTPPRKTKEYWNGDIPWATVKDFKSDRISKTVECISRDGLENSASRVVPSGTVLLVTRVGLGKVAIADTDVAINQDIKAVLPSKDVLPEFLLWALKNLRPKIEARGTGATVKGVTLPDIREMQIPLPSLDEQRRIVGILNRAAKIERLRTQAADRLRKFIPALFINVFGDQDQIGARFPCVPLKEATAIASGATKGRRIVPDDAIEVPYLRVANVQDGFLNLGEIKTMTIRRGEESKYALASGDIVMTEGGDPDKLGRAAVWNGELAYCAHQNHVFRARPRTDVVLTDYLRDVVSSAYGKAYFLSVAKRTTGIATINKSELGDFPVPIPPIRLQTRYAETVAKCRTVASPANVSATSVATLIPSLMNQLLGEVT